MHNVITCIIIAVAAVAGWAQDMQKYSLGAPSGARFTTPDITWPAVHGDADVCLWEDDKLSAVTLTIDDNNAMNIDWWMSEGDLLDFKFTWFLITANINGYYDPGRVGSAGTWTKWRNVYEHGHAVQSHSVSHGNNSLFQAIYGDSADYTLDWYHYYDGAREIIEDSIPGNKCITMAAPGSGTNNLDSAALYFISNRGTVAYPQHANAINFKNTRNSSRFIESHVNTLVDDTTLIWGKNYRRGWACFLWHYVAGDSASQASTHASLQFLKDREDSLWVARYPDLVRYNMEYATLTMNTLEVSDTLLRYTLTDSMADTIYNYPLTVKVRLNSDWDTCIATQNGTPVDAKLIDHNGDAYALVKMVPDRGEVMLAKSGQATGIRHPVENGQSTFDRKQQLFRLTGEEIPAGMQPGPGVYLVYDGKRLVKTVIME